jgi:RNA polymerase II subunit A C-terminal domain phosphatase
LERLDFSRENVDFFDTQEMSAATSSSDARAVEVVLFKGQFLSKITKIKVRKNELVAKDQILLLYEQIQDTESQTAAGVDGKVRAKLLGSVLEVLVKEGDSVQDGSPLFSIKRGCPHPVIMKDMCADCGADLRKDGQLGVRMEAVTAAVPMVLCRH